MGGEEWCFSYTDVRGTGEVGSEKLRPEWVWLGEEAAVVLELVQVGGEVSGGLGEQEVSDQSKGKVVVRRRLHL